jgi:hypothetical protein
MWRTYCYRLYPTRPGSSIVRATVRLALPEVDAGCQGDTIEYAGRTVGEREIAEQLHGEVYVTTLELAVATLRVFFSRVRLSAQRHFWG